MFCTECGRPYPAGDLVRFGSGLVCGDCKPRFVQRLQEGAVRPLAVQYGGFWRRFAALFLDGIIMMIFLLPLQLLLGVGVGALAAPRQGQHAAMMIGGALGLYYLLTVAIAVTYQAYFLSQKGATPGKMALGLKVVTPDGGRIGVGRAIARYFAQMLSAFTFLIGYIIAAFDTQKRALHDYICSTRVIRT
jgi:uncharacterized RDD family membrane protein YckC